MATLFPIDKLFVIAGPCVVEGDALNLSIAKELQRLSPQVPGGIVFKASFDKANRSNRGAARGPGVAKGIAALERVKSATGMPVITDVHLPEQCAEAAGVADALQIPAFLCRQTDLLVAAGATGVLSTSRRVSGFIQKECAEQWTRFGARRPATRRRLR